MPNDLLTMIEKTWGFRMLRPLQEEAIRAVLDQRDSLVVMPTGGGKSLCFQAPPVIRGDTTVVISPLISLMKDQVDGLRECGVAAVQLDSSQSLVERNAFEIDAAQGAVRLLFVSPERLMTDSFQRLLRQIRVKTFAIDEAHCISHWGHDFRPEYRQLQLLRERFPDATLHGYTATATERVRDDIVRQMGLRDPVVLVGDFYRSNLNYRVLRRNDTVRQVLDVLKRHKDEAGIIYCIRRRDVNELCESLRHHQYHPLPYHAGLTPEQRRDTQDAFANERCDLVVATVAFGMGIDRSNIRFVLHTGMPKSIEHYQQEAGRAGRDGLPAECVLLTSGGDFMTWKTIVEKSAEEAGLGPDFVRSAVAHLDDINRYCRGSVCRHRILVEYFGQPFALPNCNACDICNGDLETEPDSTVIAQKILSCVARVKEGYGGGHVAAVLRGEIDERIARLGHDKLSTFGLLKTVPKSQIRNWIEQLIGQKLLEQSGTEYPILKLNAASYEVMRSQRDVALTKAAKRDRSAAKKSAPPSFSDAADAELFGQLRQLRRQIAGEIAKPPYIIFTDDVLRALVRARPTTPEAMRRVSGVGDFKMKQYGPRFLDVIRNSSNA